MSRDDFIEYDESDPKNPYRPGDVSQAPRPTSGLAIASFVCGVVFCVPFLTSTLAIVFGIAGLRSTRNPYVGGRNWAISGIILGVVGIALWLFVGSMFYMVFGMITTEQAKAETVAVKFFQNLSEGKVDAAAEMTTKSVDRAKLTEASTAMQPSGPFNELLCNFQPIPIRNTMEFRMEVDGDVIFSRDRKRISMTLTPDGDTYKIDRFKMDE